MTNFVTSSVTVLAVTALSKISVNNKIVTENPQKDGD